MTLNDLVTASTKRVEEENHTCYWTADGYKFDNKNLVLYYHKKITYQIHKIIYYPSYSA